MNTDGRPRSPATAGHPPAEIRSAKASNKGAPKRARDVADDEKRATSASSNDATTSAPPGEHGQKKQKTEAAPSGVKRRRVTWPADDKIANIRHFTKDEKEDAAPPPGPGQVSKESTTVLLHCTHCARFECQCTLTP